MGKIGLVIAMDSELEYFLKLCGEYEKCEIAGNPIYTFVKYPNLVVMRCGVGTVQAAIGTTILIREYCVERILNYGFAGYYDTDLSAGDIVNVETVIDCDMNLVVVGNKPGQYRYFPDDRFTLDSKYFEDITDIKRHLSSSDQFLEDGDERNKIIATFGRNLADMEGVGVAVACYKLNVPCSIVKCISNALNENFADYREFSKHGIEECARRVFEKITS